MQNIVSKHSSQFRGNAQHDALEFLLWLLDRMHEDLGAASPAQQTPVPEEVGDPTGAAAHPGVGGGCPHQIWDREAEVSWEGAGCSCPPDPGMGWAWGGRLRVTWFGRCDGGGWRALCAAGLGMVVGVQGELGGIGRSPSI